ncbi:3694_t:CDS:2 [Ambispora gerdemannii]|uniref:Pre-mRNA-splicing factor 38 n=1 Tax=Ambispora gerdemannii TaxID=144530 RepID=A0A9N8UZ90_9GLOM|nr:3694_t:CDS:2 [Ambispora gerdemannii]
MKHTNKLETEGNEKMNMNNILFQNIQASPYFKQLYELKTYHEVIDEIYNEVSSLEPFLKGTTASTAFCLLYKLWTLRLTVKQVTGLIDHTDSPHIRALGFLYLRYVCKPADLWGWFEHYLDDEEEIQIQAGSRPVIITIGQMCRQLMTEQKWIGTMLPRIPVPIARDIDQKLKARSQPPPPPPRRESPSYDLEPRISADKDLPDHVDYENMSEVIGIVDEAETETTNDEEVEVRNVIEDTEVQLMIEKKRITIGTEAMNMIEDTMNLVEREGILTIKEMVGEGVEAQDIKSF